MKFVSVAQMVAIEREANTSGLTYDQMMENAGRRLAEVVLEEYGYLEERSVLGLVGSGNNGGDTLVALDVMAGQGWRAHACIVRPRAHDDPLVKRLSSSGGLIYSLEADPGLERFDQSLKSCVLILDGVLGTGIKLPLKPDLAAFFKQVQAKLANLASPPLVVAVDCPSGVDCDSGEAAPESLKAELTVTMAAFKQGLFKFPAYELAGDIRLVGIGLPNGGEGLRAWQEVQSFIPDKSWLRQFIPARALDAHKGTFGTALVVAGSQNYTGAALLAGKAAYRIGAGLVTLAVPRSIHSALAGQFLEATWLPLPDLEGHISSSAAELLKVQVGRVTSLLLGPGFGLAATTAKFLEEFLRVTDLPTLTVDADGLKLLGRIKGWWRLLPAPSVLTPHPGEMRLLSGLGTSEIQADRLEIAKRYSKEWGHVLVLKGAFTVIASPDGQAAIIPVATPALARAGTGDVLAGLIAGLVAQGVHSFPAAVIGAWVHAFAGLRAVQMVGNAASVLAGDVLDSSIDLISELHK